MKTIYLVAAHYAPNQYGELLDALRPSLVITHLDNKTDSAPFHKIAAGRNKTVFVPEAERVDVCWGGWSQVAATLAMLRAAKSHIQADDYVILLSGDSYPLQARDRIEDFLADGDGAQYMSSVPMPSVTLSKPIRRVSRLYLEYNPRNGGTNYVHRAINRIGIPRNYKKAFKGRDPYAGSNWWALTGQAVTWIMDEVARNPRFVQFCKRTQMPDEFFFQTLLANSPYAGRLCGSLMFADWSRPTGPRPAILDRAHIDALREDRLLINDGGGDSIVLFARKVVDSQTVALIRAETWPCTISQAAR